MSFVLTFSLALMDDRKALASSCSKALMMHRPLSSNSMALNGRVEILKFEKIALLTMGPHMAVDLAVAVASADEAVLVLVADLVAEAPLAVALLDEVAMSAEDSVAVRAVQEVQADQWVILEYLRSQTTSQIMPLVEATKVIPYMCET
jgi:hypothetical protein